MSLAGLIHLPALASIAVAWHRLILLGERVAGAFYLRLDRIVWRYTLALVVVFVLISTLDLFVARYFSDPPQDMDLQSMLVEVGALGVASAIVVFLGLRIPLVLPSIALGESLSPMDAWRATRGNTTPILKASSYCVMPLSMLGRTLMLADINSRETYVLVFTAIPITVLLLVTTWVALLSLMYRFFVLERPTIVSLARP